MSKFNVELVSGVGGYSPTQGVLTFKGSNNTKFSGRTMLKAVTENPEDKGVIIEARDFYRALNEFLNLIQLFKKNDIRVTIKVETDLYEFLKIVGQFSAKKSGMDLGLAEKMMGSQDDLAVAIGGSILDYYIGDYYVRLGNGEIIRVATGGTVYGADNQD